MYYAFYLCFLRNQDFGLATRSDSYTSNLSNLASVVAAIRWSAIEILQGLGNPDVRSDVWSLGVLIWEVSKHFKTILILKAFN